MDGIGTAKQYAERAAELGQPALAQTDHGTLSGALHHILACGNRDDKGKPVRAGDPIVPISGVEAYFRPDRAKAKEEKDRQAWHLCLFAKNLTGWHNLLKLVSTAYAEPEDGGGFYQYPCVDWQLLERYHEGLVCSTACIASWLSHLVNLGHSSEVRSYIHRMRKIFGDDLWIEIMPHDFDDQRTLNIELVRVANEYSIPLIATNDAHFPYKEWADTHRIAKMMGSGSSFHQVEVDQAVGKADYLADLNPTLYLADEEEMFYWFDKFHPDLKESVVDEAMANTMLFAQSVKPFMLDRNIKLPKVTESVEESEKILRAWMKEGLDRLERTYEPEHWNIWSFQSYLDRAEREFAVLKSKGVLDYFVMVAEVVRWMDSTDPLPRVQPGERDDYPVHRIKGYKKRPIRNGCRGSAAGSLVSYLIGITRVDPISYGLLFERFLNVKRKGLPDIDLDIASFGRKIVKEFIARRYGRSHVADIITHTTFQPKKVLSDLARVYDIPVHEAKRITKPIHIRQDDEDTTLEEILPLYPHLQKLKEARPDMWKQALRFEGTVANPGKHAAGIVITPRPVEEFMALERSKAGDPVTSWSDAADFAIISDFGFVKLDALGIRTFEIHEYACKLIEDRTGVKVDLFGLSAFHNSRLVDPKVMLGFQKGITKSVFQFGSRGIRKLLVASRPETILDLTALNALYRPGPIKSGVIWEFPKRKKNPFLRQYLHPDLKEWLEETYGLIAFQEQVMQVASGIGRMDAADTDDLRKAMGKLYRIKGGTAAKDFMRKYEVPFFDGAIKDHGWDHATAELVWNMFLEFGHYGFNKSHSADYALRAYQDMWLKVYYPHEFYAAALTFEEDDEEVKELVREARSDLLEEITGKPLEVAPPLLNQSAEGYNTDGKVVRLGLTAINQMGGKAAKIATKNRPFKDADDLFARGSGIPFRQAIESGACDDFLDRSYMLSWVKKVKRDGSDEEWQVWEHLKHNVKLVNKRDVPKFRKELSAEQLASVRAASFAVPMNESNLTPAAVEYIREQAHLGDEYAELDKGDSVICGGEIVKVDIKTASNGREYANIRLVFESDDWMVKLWEQELATYRHLLFVGSEIMVAGRKDIWNDFESVVVDEMVSVEEFFTSDEEEAA